MVYGHFHQFDAILLLIQPSISFIFIYIKGQSSPMFKYGEYPSCPVQLLWDTIFIKHWTVSVSLSPSASKADFFFFFLIQTKTYQWNKTLSKDANPFEVFWLVYLQSSVESWRCYSCCSSCISSPFVQFVSYEYGILFTWGWHALTSALFSLIIWGSGLWANLQTENSVHLSSYNSWIRNLSWALL